MLRSKLVPVLCTLLHLQPDETKVINEKWAVRTGGLVGWLLPPRPPLPSAASGPGGGLASDSQDPQMDVMVATGKTTPMARGAKRGGDLTYDPVTGSVVGGLDIYA